MNSSDIYTLGLIAGIVALVMILKVVCDFCKARERRSYIEQLPEYARIKRLAEQTNSHAAEVEKESRIWRFNLKSKREFDNFDYRRKMRAIIADGLESLGDDIDSVERNVQAEDAYKTMVSGIASTAGFAADDRPWCFDDESDLRGFIESESTGLIDFVRDLKFRVFYQYTSPQGRNHYEKTIVFRIVVLSELLEDVREAEARKATTAYQRELVTPSVRFAIMKRDGYRCRICGRSAADGVELEIDHIVLVSKGGQSTPDNLWTLCFDCNRGKRADDL